MYFKDFNRWNQVKQTLNREERNPCVRAGEIRWATFGVNVGSEIDGKGNSFTRPVLIIHTIGNYLALVVPMSTKLKHSAGYVPFNYNDKNVSLCLHQMRAISQKRIFSRLLKIPGNQLRLVKSAISTFFNMEAAA